MTLEVCNTMENIGNCDIQYNFQDMVPDTETELATKHLEEMNNSIFSESISEDSIAAGSDDCFTIFQSIDTSHNELSFFPVDVQNCIEVESSNLTNISENQIVEIQFLVNNDLVEDASVTSDILSFENPINEDITSYEIFNNEVTTNTDVIYTATDQNNSEKTTELPLKTINPLNVSVLSPQSETDEQNERDLTSLNWLHNITNIMTVPNLPTPPVSPPPKPQKKKVSSGQDLTININFYKKNGDKKPPFSYATLICMAMGKNGNKMTLSAIYHWIKENFLYYRKAHPSWQVGSTILEVGMQK